MNKNQKEELVQQCKRELNSLLNDSYLLKIMPGLQEAKEISSEHFEDHVVRLMLFRLKKRYDISDKDCINILIGTGVLPALTIQRAADSGVW